MNRLKTALFLFLVIAGSSLFAQAPPPPPSGAKGNSTNQAPGGGGAPVDAGLITLSLMVAGYGGFKWYKNKKEHHP